jgi:hypothetical protein
MLRRFRRSHSGSALTEGLIVFPIVILAISVCVEFGYMMYQWNLAAKAMQLGVRKLVVSEPLTPDFYTVFAFDDTKAGQLIDADAAVISQCGANTGVACNDDNDKNSLHRLVYGSLDDGENWPGLRNYFPKLEEGQIRVIYEKSGLGFEGRPGGPVVTVRMEIDRDAVDFPVVGQLLNGIGITFPPFTVSATSEDLTSCRVTCPEVEP